MKLKAMLLIAAMAAIITVVGVAATPSASAPPGKPAVVATANPGELQATWGAVPDAEFYTVGWISLAEYQTMQGAGRDWLDGFHYATVPADFTTHTISGARPSEEHFVIVGAGKYRFGGDAPAWSPWSDMVASNGAYASSTAPGGALTITVSEPPDNLPDYNASDWRHWVDADDDCQDTRQEVLIAESQVPVSYTDASDCRVAAGEWLGPYTNQLTTNPSDLDIDHLVALANAHRSGAWAWNDERRGSYANYLDDPQHLIATIASANRSKGAQGPEAWKPPHQAYWCQYAADWVTIKADWGLTATAAEYQALATMLLTCADPPTLIAEYVEPQVPQPTPTPTPRYQGPVYETCEAAEAAGETRVPGSNGPGLGFPAEMVPSAGDGDGDGIVCEEQG